MRADPVVPITLTFTSLGYAPDGLPIAVGRDAQGQRWCASDAECVTIVREFITAESPGGSIYVSFVEVEAKKEPWAQLPDAADRYRALLAASVARYNAAIPLLLVRNLPLRPYL